MPEGPEVRILADQAKKYLKGTKLVKVDIIDGPYKKKDSTKHKQFRNSPLNKKELIFKGIKVRGKVTVWEFEDVFKDASLKTYLYIHYNMTGHISVNKPKKPHVAFVFKNVFKDSSLKTIYWSDPRQWGDLIWMNQEELKAKIANVGPSILNVSAANFITAMRRSKTKKVSSALLDQDKISGVGNYLRSEALYLAKIHPMIPMKDLSDKDLTRLHKALQKITSQVIKAGGSSKYRDLYDTPGKYKFKIYGSGKVIKDGSRKIYYDPAVQKI